MRIDRARLVIPAMSTSKILVIGASGPLGAAITQLLVERNCKVVASYRTNKAGVSDAIRSRGASPLRLELEDAKALDQLDDDFDGVIATPILNVSAPLAARFGSMRCVFFSSNNVAIDFRSDVYKSLRLAEESVMQHAPGAAIIRPTMIYGYLGDGNIERLVGALRRSPVIPIPSMRPALQQPIFYRDLAEIAVSTLFDETITGPIGAAGPVPITMPQMISELAKAANRKVFVLRFPGGLALAGARVCRLIGITPPLSEVQIRRAGEDKTPRTAWVKLGQTPFAAGVKALVSALDGEGQDA